MKLEYSAARFKPRILPEMTSSRFAAVQCPNIAVIVRHVRERYLAQEMNCKS
jgi:hypothetical protein